MIKNIPISMVKYAMDKLGLYDLKDHSVQRLSTCYKCNGAKDLCPSCGCIVALKVIELSETCPMNKWQ
jgi:hypothetical protein